MEADNRTGCLASTDISELTKALCQAQSEFKAIKKSGIMAGPDGFRYSTWADIADAVFPALRKNGITWMPLMGRQQTGDGMFIWVLLGRLCHGPSGQFVQGICPIGGNPMDSQSFEIATTYAKKTLCKTMTGAWEEGDEAPEMTKGAEAAEKTKEQIELLQKIESQMELVKGNRAKLEKLHDRLRALEGEGKLSKSDVDMFIEKYPVPAAKLKEKADADK